MNDIARTPDGRIWEWDGTWWNMMAVTNNQWSQKNMEESGGVVIYEVSELEKYGPGTVLQNPKLGPMIASKYEENRWLFAGVLNTVYSDESVVEAFGDDGYEVIVEVKR